MPRPCRGATSPPGTAPAGDRFGSATGRATTRIGPATRLGAQARSFRATLALGDRTETVTAQASGPVAALTAMLHDRGIGVEMTGFHQLRSGDHTATFVRGGDGHRDQWAMGWAQDATESALFAVIACANRLLLQRLEPDQRSGRNTIGMPSIGTGMPRVVVARPGSPDAAAPAGTCAAADASRS